MINRNAVPLLLALLLATASPSFSATASAPVAPAASGTTSGVASGTASASVATPAAAEPSEFPLMLKGVEVLINKEVGREVLAASLTKVLGESTEMEEKTRLQYDFQTNPESSPVALMIDWDATGKIATILLDGEEAPTKDLLTWLKKQAGAGKAGDKEEGYTNTVWEYRGWSFTFRQGGSNEDTAYSITIAPAKAKAK